MWTASISWAAITAGRCSPRRIGRSSGWITYHIHVERRRLGSGGSFATGVPTISVTATEKGASDLLVANYQRCATVCQAGVPARPWKILLRGCRAERKLERRAVAFLWA